MQGNKENIDYISNVNHLADVGHFEGKDIESELSDFGVRKYYYVIVRFK